jgi:RNase P subunit RPR2
VIGGATDGAFVRGDDEMELARAYAVLGVEGDTSLEDARAAFVTWHQLYSVSDDASGWDDDASAQARHELDVALQVVERAHARTATRWRRPPACEECNRGPALQVSFTRTMPGLRARTQTTTATLCRECGLALFDAVQGKTVRGGWWGVAAPFRNVSAVVGNRVEAKFLRALDQPQGRKPAAPDRFVAAAEKAAAAKGPKKARSRTRRAMPWVTGVAAIAIAVGIAVPAGGGETPAPGTGTTSASVTGN